MKSSGSASDVVPNTMTMISEEMTLGNGSKMIVKKVGNLNMVKNVLS